MAVAIGSLRTLGPEDGLTVVTVTPMPLHALVLTAEF